MGRKLLLISLVLLAVLMLSGTLFAAGNPYGIADRREITLHQSTWVGDVFLPAGRYEVRHSMKAAEHVMLFRQMNVNSPKEARVKCTLTEVAKPIEQTQIGFRENAAKELVLNRLAFKGDRAEHRF